MSSDDASVIVLFDGVCNFCNASVNFLIDRDPRGRLRFAAQQSAAGRALLARHGVPAAPSSVVVLAGGRAYLKSDAALQIARALPWPWRAARAGAAVPRVVRDAVYDAFARRRYRLFGRSDQCRVPTPDVAARFL